MALTFQPTSLATDSRFFAIPASTGAPRSCVTNTIVLPDSAFGPVNGPVHLSMPAWILTRSAFAFATPGPSEVVARPAVAASVAVNAAATTMKQIDAILNRPCDLMTLLLIVCSKDSEPREFVAYDRGVPVAQRPVVTNCSRRGS